mmetsp:Transcript_18636/g.33679  ORF Transcript_18636/g.33679 Transcript_18636/m.33679 type:complete len:461 (+) Transcript_18636:218-1600(+)
MDADWILSTCVYILLAVAFILIVTRFKTKMIPGYRPSDKELGNFAEIGKAGSFMKFLQTGHKQFGPVFQFWWGKNRAVSLASVELFKAVRDLPDRPPQSFESFIRLIGPKSIQITNGPEWAFRNQKYHKPLLNIHAVYQNIVPKLNELIAQEVLPYFETHASPDQPIALDEVCFNYPTQSVSHILFGSSVSRDEVMEIVKSYGIVLDNLTFKKSGSQTEEEEELFEVQLERMKSVIYKAMKSADKGAPNDTMLKYYEAEDEEVKIDDMITFMVGGFHTSNFLIQWSLYLAAKYPKEQEKLLNELEHFGPNFEGKLETMPFMRNFIDEAIRWSDLAIFTVRHSEANDIPIPGGLVIPKKTMIYQSIAVLGKDESLWDNPEEFMPDRFNQAESRSLKFSPFGFAGGRGCPGRAMAYAEVKLFLAEVVRRYKVSLPHSDYTVGKNYSLISRPEPPLELIFTRR